MNREILFRGKRVDNNQWTEGFLRFIYTDGKNSNGFIYTDKAQIYSPVEVRSHDVYTATVGQFTGLCDDKERKVFEGDIVDVRGRFKSEVRYVCRNTGYLIKDNYGNWEWLYDVLASMHCEVIGNIHDNPDLAKEEAE